jgi:hypothetical protein
MNLLSLDVKYGEIALEVSSDGENWTELGKFSVAINSTVRITDGLPTVWKPPQEKFCGLCGHSLVENSHGFDQNDAVMDGDRLIHSGHCTYCKVCQEL